MTFDSTIADILLKVKVIFMGKKLKCRVSFAILKYTTQTLISIKSSLLFTEHTGNVTPKFFL